MSQDNLHAQAARDADRAREQGSLAPEEAVVEATLTEPASWTHGAARSQFGEEIEFDLRDPIRLREWISVVALVVLGDLAIYRGEGFAGFAALFCIAPMLLFLGSRQRISMPGLAVVGAMLVAVVGRLVWSGSSLQVVCGFGLLIAFSMSIAGQRPYCIDGLVFASQIVPAGLANIVRFVSRVFVRGWPARLPWLNVLLPLIALFIFGFIFIFANPDIMKLVSEQAEQCALQIERWLETFSPLEGFFWLAVIWIGLGMMRPLIRRPLTLVQKSFASQTSDEDLRTKIYPAIRNTLITVIGLFAAYLVLEFSTLWFREFPQGFYYAGYAHEGAAWLTVALGLATITLSVVFRGRLLDDQRLPTLKRLAWIWSAQNFLLAIAVYNRLLIYVNFNGMTRMRTIAFFGTTCVVVGFLLVVYKIARKRDFLWLFQHQLLTVAVAVLIYALLPVDLLVHRYNASEVLRGRLAPSVQIGWHDVDDWGLVSLIPLTECDDPRIREGIRAMLAARQRELEDRLKEREKAGWSAYQANDRRVLRKLEAASDRWQHYALDAQARNAAIDRFTDYVYQWY